jgi:hypothetical protein
LIIGYVVYFSETLNEALLETDAGGLMADLLLMMLTAVFSLQEEEEEEEAELTKEGKQQGRITLYNLNILRYNSMLIYLDIV